MGQRRQDPVEQIREAVLVYEKDLDGLVKAAKHKKRAQLIQDLRARVGSFDARITQAIQEANPALRQVAPDLQASSQETLQLASELEQQNWARVQMDHQEARHLIRHFPYAVESSACC